MNNKIYLFDEIEDGVVGRKFIINLHVKKLVLYSRSISSVIPQDSLDDEPYETISLENILSEDKYSTIYVRYTTESMNDNDSYMLLNNCFIRITISLEDMYLFDVEDEDTLEGNLVDIENFLERDCDYSNINSVDISILNEKVGALSSCSEDSSLISLNLTRGMTKHLINYFKSGIGELEFFNSYIEYE